MYRTRDEAARAATTISRRWPLVSGGIALALAILLGLLIWQRNGNLPLEADRSWLAEVRESPSGYLDVLSYLMNWVGGGFISVFVIPLIGAGTLLFLRRPTAAAYWIVSLALSAGLVQLIKGIVGRPRPEDIMVVSDFGSFPSGHTANAATTAVVLGVIFPRFWVWFAGACYVALMVFSRTYLGAHWLSDTIGGLLLGIGVALVLWAPFALRLRREPTSRPTNADSRR